MFVVPTREVDSLSCLYVPPGRPQRDKSGSVRTDGACGRVMLFGREGIGWLTCPVTQVSAYALACGAPTQANLADGPVSSHRSVTKQTLVGITCMCSTAPPNLPSNQHGSLTLPTLPSLVLLVISGSCGVLSLHHPP